MCEHTHDFGAAFAGGGDFAGICLLWCLLSKCFAAATRTSVLAAALLRRSLRCQAGSRLARAVVRPRLGFALVFPEKESTPSDRGGDICAMCKERMQKCYWAKCLTRIRTQTHTQRNTTQHNTHRHRRTHTHIHTCTHTHIHTHGRIVHTHKRMLKQMHAAANT